MVQSCATMQVKASVAGTGCRLRRMSSAADGYFLANSLELPADLRALEVANLAALATEVRALLNHNVATPPEQLAPALGAVELAIAVHHVFDTSADRIVWDSGPQSWAHRVLNGRRDRPASGAYPGALQLFRDDACAEGRPGTAIGAALGMAVAAARLGEERHVVAVVADHALIAGMALEALNHAGALPADMLVILNDSDPAHSGGALSNQLAMVLSGPVYTQLRDGGKKVLRQMPTVRELARRSEQHLKGMVLPGTMFEELGFNYIGPLDGHNIGALVATLRNVKRLRGPQFLHVLTRRGATAAAGTPRATGNHAAPVGRLTYGEVFGRWLCDMAESDPNIIAIAPARGETSGLHEFARRFPQRCFDASIGEQHAVTFAAGLAAAGLRPVVAISSTSLQRAYDQLIHDVALQRLPVMFAVHHAGLVGGDLGSEHGAYDLSYLRCVPNLTIMAPADESECRQMLHTARMLPGPAVVRYPCGGAGAGAALAALSVLPTGRAEVCREGGSGVALLVFGALLAAAAGAAESLDATLVNMRFAKPLDEDLLAELCARHRALVTIEDNVVAGGAGTGVAELLASRGLRIPLLQLGIPDRFTGQGARLTCLAAARLDAPGLTGSIRQWWLRAGTKV
jgi:1-deoxy-D-xylulose-5-phosphate synthase